MKLLKYHRKPRKNTFRGHRETSHKRKAQTPPRTNCPNKIYRQEKVIEPLSELANDRANEAFDIIVSKLRTRDIYNLAITNTACCERIQTIMSKRKTYEFNIISEDTKPNQIKNKRTFGSPNAISYITNSIDPGPCNGNTDVCPSGLYYRQITFWKAKEERRTTRSDYMPSLAARFLHYERIAKLSKPPREILNKHGFSLRDEYNGECHNQNYSVEIVHSKLRVTELYKSHLARTTFQPLEGKVLKRKANRSKVGL